MPKHCLLIIRKIKRYSGNSVYIVSLLIDFPNEIELIQSQFFKRVYNLPSNCNNSALRTEFSLCQLFYYVIKRALNWIEDVLKMDNNRLPKICLFSLIKQAEKHSVDAKYNWYLKIRLAINSIGYENVNNIQEIISRKEQILDQARTHFMSLDYINAVNSKSLLFYKDLLIMSKDSNYLASNLSLHRLKNVVQLRLMNIYNSRLIVNKK